MPNGNTQIRSQDLKLMHSERTIEFIMHFSLLGSLIEHLYICNDFLNINTEFKQKLVDSSESFFVMFTIVKL